MSGHMRTTGRHGRDRTVPTLLMALVAALLVVVHPPARADDRDSQPVTERSTWKVVQEQWYVIRVAGVDCGWMRAAQRDDGSRYRTETEMSLSLDRGGETVSVSTATEFDETHRGEPVRLLTMQRMGHEPVETVYEFVRGEDGASDRRVVRRATQGGIENVGEEPWPAGAWLPPVAADRLFASRRDAGVKEIVYQTIDGHSGLQVATVKSVRVGEARVEIGGRSVPATRWRVSTSAIPVESVVLFGADGVLVESRVDLGFGEMLTQLATEEDVRRLRPGRLPDVILSTTVRLERPIRDVMRTRRAAFRLSMPEGMALPDLPSVGAQRFERVDARVGVVRIDRDAPAPASTEEIENAGYRAASPTVDSDDPLIRTLLDRATRRVAGRSPAERAEACRAFVGRHVRDKGLEVAFATASEVARRGEGDCSEHAVLLCALLRADGIPSRLASGLIYVDEFAGQRRVFGWHMWTQALLEVTVDGEAAWRWIDLDATLPVPNHAAYVLTATTSLTHGPADTALTAMLPLLGRMTLAIEE